MLFSRAFCLAQGVILRVGPLLWTLFLLVWRMRDHDLLVLLHTRLVLALEQEAGAHLLLGRHYDAVFSQTGPSKQACLAVRTVPRTRLVEIELGLSAVVCVAPTSGTGATSLSDSIRHDLVVLVIEHLALVVQLVLLYVATFAFTPRALQACCRSGRVAGEHFHRGPCVHVLLVAQRHFVRITLSLAVNVMVAALVSVLRVK